MVIITDEARDEEESSHHLFRSTSIVSLEKYSFDVAEKCVLQVGSAHINDIQKFVIYST
jgi:hypothetical protein